MPTVFYSHEIDFNATATYGASLQSFAGKKNPIVKYFPLRCDIRFQFPDSTLLNENIKNQSKDKTSVSILIIVTSQCNTYQRVTVLLVLITGGLAGIRMP